MKLHELTANPGARKTRKRVGRGNASKGTTAGRGANGQNSRTGGGVRIGFEGGQSTLLQRMPKRRGFKNPNRKEFAPVNLKSLEANFADGDVITLDTLKKVGLIKSNAKLAKVLGHGEIQKKLSFEGVAVSAAAKAKIEKAGGTIHENK